MMSLIDDQQLEGEGSRVLRDEGMYYYLTR